MTTQTLGLFEAKTRLSELVARAEQGEEVIITRHNKPVAKIVPMTQGSSFDRERRREAVAALRQLGQEIAERHGAWTADEPVGWVREVREEREEQVWRGVACRKP
ncbi:type II toxin-antitoxin system Phd/YefM family antitoxin [Aquabacterium sp. J223]|uniref:type II toxin-antitoxin system Phd/YefM family antitoxin n=1 Tax=Aquabacterium sp. J223 TaxID=2898431 RepID=UPI0021ADB930|nr:type II toxin-antitoxin system prevent-host-death family antitoxin [Aquabacterium sp. J223]UUX95127.1 type II toxin-antitoxin system prevent-host-death family antitoxin [Aquabacterium sp. J223]